MFLPKLIIILLAFQWIHSADKEDVFERSYKYFGKTMESFLKTNPTANVSENCRTDLLTYSNYLQKLKKRRWALKMYDSNAKLPSGVFRFHEVVFGDYDQCMEIVSSPINGKTIEGKYCIGTLYINYLPLFLPRSSETNTSLGVVRRSPSKERMIFLKEELGIMMGVCLPKTCDAKDMQTTYTGMDIEITLYDDLCHTPEDQWKIDSDAIIVLCFFGLILLIIVFSTLYDTIMHYNKQPLEKPNELLSAFSLLKNVKTLCAISDDEDQITCLHGIRSLSAIWVVLAHKLVVVQFFPQQNLIKFLKFRSNSRNMYIMGGSLAVDSFFFMSGFFVAYVFIKSIRKGREFNIIFFYLHRILRLTPVLGVMIVIHLTLVKYFSSGPIYQTAVYPALIQPCEVGWWRTLLFIHNYGSRYNYCVPQSWYLNPDTQLYVISPIILLLLRRKPIMGILLAFLLALVSMALCFAAGWIAITNNTWPLNPDLDFFRFSYDETYARAAPWMIGVLFGYIIFEFKQRGSKLPLNTVFIFALWGLLVAILASCVFGGYDIITSEDETNALRNAFSNSLIRPTWAVGIGCIILLCISGHGGPVNWFLSLPMFQVLSKLTFTIYLTHYIIQFVIAASMRTTPLFDSATLLYTFWGEFMIALLAAIILTLSVELPVVNLERVLLGIGKHKKKSSPVGTNCNEEVD